MPSEHTQPPRWSKQDAREMRLLAKHLRRLNKVAGVYTPSGAIIDEASRCKYLALAGKFSEAFGGQTGPWAAELAWGAQQKDERPCRTP